MSVVVPLNVPPKRVEGKLGRNITWQYSFDKARNTWTYVVTVQPAPYVFRGETATEAAAKEQINAYLAQLRKQGQKG